ncbi:hypothetical protein [Paraburkholderia oxyphila]|uniref:hypothetical protein n=1 Tax=Paraburkholderia oxyphila TaxID=614212 RepID=UPI000AE9FF52|nr:hypothetical protein [Paraburkholderia oxyphila]
MKNTDMTFAKFLRSDRAQKGPHVDISSYDDVLFDAPRSKNWITRAALLKSGN